MFLLSVLQMIHKVFKRVICNFVKKLRFSKAKTLQASGKTETDSHPTRDRELQIKTDMLIHSITCLLSVKTKQVKFTCTSINFMWK